MSATLELARQLIARPSVTPSDEGCQQMLGNRLRALGFELEHVRFGEVDNLWATLGSGGPLLMFAGHTDVVPPGPLTAWTQDPFAPTERDGLLYGRGSADMKGSLAAMITAVERMLASGPALNGQLAFLITSDEEGMAIDGTRRMVDLLSERNIKPDYCVIGEPSSTEVLGDTIKIGRRGSLSAKLFIRGIKGHIAYPHLARNPIHEALPALHELVEKTWDEGNQAFPPTSFQISNIHGGVGANNVIPGSVEVDFNIRYSTEQNAAGLQKMVEETLKAHETDFECQWHLSGEPFLTTARTLIDTVSGAVQKATGIFPEASTAGGTSDGRFIAKLGSEIVELGPVNASIHKVDEHVRVVDLERLSEIYQDIMQNLIVSTNSG